MEEKIVELERRVVQLENNQTDIAQEEALKALRKDIEDLKRNVALLPSKSWIEEYISHYMLDKDELKPTDKIFGYKPINAQKLAGLFPTTNYSREEIEHILNLIDQECKILNFNPYFVIAQMIHETGWLRSKWSAEPYRNPAGYGVTGRSSDKPKKDTDTSKWQKMGNLWYEGFAFDSWEIAIKTWLAHLLRYSLKDEDATDKQKKYMEQSPRAKLVKSPGIDNLEGLNGKWNAAKTDYIVTIVKLANKLDIGDN